MSDSRTSPTAEKDWPEYHRHDSGDVVQGPALRCIDPDAGARDVLVIDRDAFQDGIRAQAEMIREAQAQAWAEGHAAGQDYAGDGGCDRPGCAHDPRDDNPYLSIPPVKESD